MAPKRKRSESDDGATAHNNHKRFAYLKPRVRHISERTIKCKWTTLPEPVQEKVREMFRSLERPVIVRHRDERKRIEAQTAVAAVVKNLGRRLPRMPFPPLTKDANFDYEAALQEHRSLEAQLSTTTNSIDLLKMELEKEEALLAKETKQLEEMEKNAKRAEAERKRQMKNEHPVLRHLESLPRHQERAPAPFSVLDGQDSDTALCDVDPDPELLSLITQLNGHLQSMQNNVAPFVGLKDAITQAQVALDLLSIPAD
ncbi:hypothetical protein VTN77DRAFT_4857 [Rasamsonia byssochlamydoides]|uniref:uncharacterized protein n=1 Tax=Rasamsonia byssochlamydoides TaxID=89139 RepID=UPI0037420E25